jgi:hypothetical protein
MQGKEGFQNPNQANNSSAYYPFVAQPLNVPFTVPGVGGNPQYSALPTFSTLPSMHGMVYSQPPRPFLVNQIPAPLQTLSSPPVLMGKRRYHF